MLSSAKLSEQQLNDLGNNFIRTQLAVVQGAALPYPYGGKVRQVQVDLNPQAMQAYGVSAQDVNAAIGNQNAEDGQRFGKDDPGIRTSVAAAFEVLHRALIAIGEPGVVAPKMFGKKSLGRERKIQIDRAGKGKAFFRRVVDKKFVKLAGRHGS